SYAPPLVGEFQDRDALVAYVQTFGAANGYGVSIARSKPNVVYLTCDRGGSYRNHLNLTDEIRRRSTSSRLIGCSFALCGTKKSNGIGIFSQQNSVPEDNQLEQLLEEFYQQYNTWMVPRQTRARDELLKIITKQPMHLSDPTIAYTRGRPMG
ncbi:1564_t:CDS:2, partial [Racocetra fulgida]